MNSRRTMSRRGSWPRLLRLENRITPALTSDFDRITGLLSIVSDADDSIVVTADDAGHVRINATLFLPDGVPLRANAVSHLDVQGGPGKNLIDLSGIGTAAIEYPNLVFYIPDADGTPVPSRRAVMIRGGGGDDTITGSPFGDFIDGEAGADVLNGSRGNDLMRWEFSDAMVDGGAGFDEGYLSLDGMAPMVPAIQAASVTPTGSVVFTVDGVNSGPVAFMEQMSIVGGNFAAASGSATMTFKTATGGAAIDQLITFDDFGAAFLTVEAAGQSQASNKKKYSLYFPEDMLYVIESGNGNDSLAVTPGRSKVNLNGRNGNDSLTVNHLGYPATMGVGLVQVAGRATVNHVSVESVQTGRTVFGGAAQAELQANGITASANVTSVGTTNVMTITIKNQSSLPLTDLLISISGNQQAMDIPDGTSSTFFVGEKHIRPQRIRTTGGLTFSVDPNPQGTPIADLLAGEFPYSPHVTFKTSVIPSGGTATGTIEFPRDFRAEAQVAAIKFVGGWGASSYQYAFHGYENYGIMKQPTIVASVTPSGQTSTSAGSSLVGVSANGRVVLHLSAAPDYDPYVTTVFPGTHVFVNNVMVDTTPAGTASGNGASSDPVISASGRWVAFVTAATNLGPAGSIDVNNANDVVVRDLFSSQTMIVSKTPNGMTGNGKSFAPRISADGRYVYFLSDATDLVSGVIDTNGATDLFRFDTTTKQLTCVSVIPGGTATGNKGVDLAGVTLGYSISPGGDDVGWFSEATDLTMGGSPPGMHAYAKKGANHPDFLWWPTAPTQTGLQMVPDGSRVFFWTDTNFSTATGVADTNGVSDLFEWTPTSGQVRALSVNGAKTAMGDGPTPGDPFDGVASNFDGSKIVFTSDADNLLSGPAVPTSDGLFQFSGLGGTMPTIERLDVTPTGFGGDNHNPTISPDGAIVAWNSPTNYGATPGTFTQPQLWVRNVAGTIDNLAGTFGLNGSFPTRRPFLADGGHVVLFESRSPFAGGDANSFFDVYYSIGHQSLAYTAPTGNGIDNFSVEMKKIGATPHVRVFDSLSGADLAERPLAATRWLFLHGADNEGDAVTIEYGTGLAGLSDIVFDGGTGDDTIHQSANNVELGDGMYLVSVTVGDVQVQNTFLVFTSALRLTATGVEELRNKLFVGGLSWYTDSASTTTVDGIIGTGETRLSTKVGGHQIDGYFGELSELNIISRAGSSPGVSSITFNDVGTIAKSALMIKLPVYVCPSDASVNAANMTIPVRIQTGHGNDTITGGSANDIINAGGGKNVVNGGLGDDTYQIDSFFDVSSIAIMDSSGRDTLDFSAAPNGITVDYTVTAPQLLTSLGHELTLNGQFEKLIGSSFDDQAKFKPLVAPLILEFDGKATVFGGVGNRLIFDCLGKPTADVGGKIYQNSQLTSINGNLQITQLTNNAPALQVAAVIINDGAVQRSMVTDVVVAFNGAASFVGTTESAFQLSGPGGLVSVVAAAQTISGTTSVRLTFPLPVNIGGSLLDGLYTLSVISSRIVGGLIGGNYVSAPGDIHRLFGDADGNRLVNAADFNAFRLAYGTNGPSIFDFDGDLQVTAADFNQFRLRYGMTV